jgi:DNA-binding beta-propeller fold protein YncE
VDDNDTGPEPCAQSTDGLEGSVFVAVSPDGASVYTASRIDNAVARFDRAPATGALTPQGCVDDNDTGPDACAQSVDGLDAPSSVAVSPGGASVYAASQFDDAVVRFDRNTATGALSPQGCVDDNDTGADTCAQSADGLDAAISVAISPDGASVYVGSGVDNAVVRFDRQPDSPETTITKKPKKKATRRKAKFGFTSDDPEAGFECKIDKKAFKPCISPKKYRVKPGRHRFQVRATDLFGNEEPTPAKFKWKVLEG